MKNYIDINVICIDIIDLVFLVINKCLGVKLGLNSDKYERRIGTHKQNYLVITKKDIVITKKKRSRYNELS